MERGNDLAEIKAVKDAHYRSNCAVILALPMSIAILLVELIHYFA